MDAALAAKFKPGKCGEASMELANRQARTEAMAIARARRESRRRGDDDDITAGGDKVAKDAVPEIKAQRNSTDPDVRIMKRADGSFSYCWNGRAVVGKCWQIIVAAEMN